MTPQEEEQRVAQAVNNLKSATSSVEYLESKAAAFKKPLRIQVQDVGGNQVLVDIRGGEEYDQIIPLAKSVFQELLTEARNKLSEAHQKYLEISASGSTQARGASDD